MNFNYKVQMFRSEDLHQWNYKNCSDSRLYTGSGDRILASSLASRYVGEPMVETIDYPWLASVSSHSPHSWASIFQNFNSNYHTCSLYHWHLQECGVLSALNVFPGQRSILWTSGRCCYGIPISPIVSNLFMETFERRALETAEVRPKAWLRYIDDVFAIWNRDQQQLRHLNSQHPNIEFTVGNETDGMISFLDVQVERRSNKICTSVFRKNTHIDRYINFNSHHHQRTLTGVVKCLKNRADRICHSSTKNQKMTHLQWVFEANGFPRPTVRKILSYPRQDSSPTDEREKMLYLPYVRGLSERTEQVCWPLNITTVFKSSFTPRHSLVQFKNRTPANRKKAVLYEITCGDCEAVYIGETGRTLAEESNRTQVCSTETWHCGLHINPIWNPILNYPYQRLPILIPQPHRTIQDSHLFHHIVVLQISQNFNSNYQYVYVHYVTITSLPVYNLESLRFL